MTNDEWAAEHKLLMSNIEYALKHTTNLSEEERYSFKRLMVMYIRQEYGDE